MIYINKIQNRIMFKIKTPETIKLLGSTKSKITKDKNGENVLHLEITKVILVRCNIQESRIKNQESCIHLFL